MKIENINLDAFSSNKKMKSSRRSKSGVLLTILIMGLYFGNHYYNDEKDNSMDMTSETVVAEFVRPVTVTVDEINDLNIIINNSNCSESFVLGIVEELRTKGLNINLTSNYSDINVDNSIVITLDQQYISGPGMVVLAPYENSRLGNSDALALSMQTGFKQEGFEVGEVHCGKTGYVELDDGTVVEMVPSETENNIDKDKKTSFVELCFGTYNTDSKDVARAIESSLARYVKYMKEEKVESDLIYRSEIGQTRYQACEKMGIPILGESDTLLQDNTIIKNPHLMTMNSFDDGITIKARNYESNLHYSK